MDYQTKIIVDATKALRDLQKLEKVFKDNQKAVNALNKNVKMLNSSLIANSKRTKVVSSSQKKMASSMSLVNKYLKIQLVLFRTAMLLYSSWATIKLYIEFNKTAESLDLLGRKLKMFTGNAKSLDIIKESAMKVGASIQDLGKIVTRFAITTDGAFSAQTLTKWTEALVVSGRAAGTSTMELNNALIQLSQSFSAGYLMGDEYRSISENLPIFKLALRDVADQAGYANQSLKELSSGRKIDIELMSKALEKLSVDSKKYTFALDNIAAAEGRVLEGWQVFANSIADSRSLKDSLNFIAGAFAYLANDGASIRAFEDVFPEMSKSVEEFVLNLYYVKDATELVIKEFGKLGVTIGSADYFPDKKFFSDFFKDIFDKLNEFPINVKTVSVMMYSSFKTFVDSVIALFDYLYEDAKSGVMEFFAVFDKYITRMRMGFNKITGDEKEYNQLKVHLEGVNSILKDLDAQQENGWDATKKKIQGYKDLDASVQMQALNERDESLKTFKYKQKLMETARKANIAAAKIKSKVEPEKDRGFEKRERINKKEVTAYNNAVKKASKNIASFYENQKSLNSEINKLKNPFSNKIDASKDYKNMEDQIKRLVSARKYNIITEKEYNDKIKEVIASTNELINLKQDEHYNKLSRSYDKVKEKAFKLKKVEKDLKELYDKKLISIHAYNKALKDQQRELNKALAESGQMSETDQFFKGMNDGMYEFANNSKTTFELISDLTTKSFNSMTDELTNFVMNGKADFKSLVNSIISDLARIAIQKSITEPLAGALSGVFSGGISSLFGGGVSSFFGGSGLSGFGSISGSTSLGSLSGYGFFENGGAFNGGKVIPFAKGDVFDSPSYFPMGKNLGVMGEAGPEAIMPLSRGGDGKLGVKSKPAIVNVVINNNTKSTTTQKESTDNQGNRIVEIFIDEIDNELASRVNRGSGSLSESLEGTYGLNRTAGSVR